VLVRNITTALLGFIPFGFGMGTVSAQGTPLVPPRYSVVEDIPYGPGGPDQTLDLYLPDASGRQRATLIVLNSGSGNKGPLVQWFAERGYPVLFVNVRKRDPYPQPVRDAFCAVAWAHEKVASYGLDPHSLVALGHSGGAVLAAHLGTVDDPGLYLEGCATRFQRPRGCARSSPSRASSTTGQRGNSPRHTTRTRHATLAALEPSGLRGGPKRLRSVGWMAASHRS
jgi:hypothetical protein